MKSTDPALTSRHFEQLFTPNPGRTLIVGSHVYAGKVDRRKRYTNVVGVDAIPGPGVDRVLDLEESLPEDFGTFAHCECMSVLEHSKRPWLLAANVQRALEPGGSLYLAVPFIWRVHGYPDDYWRFTMSGAKLLFPEIVWEHESYAHNALSDADHIPATMMGGLPFFARTEVVLFGRKHG